MKFTTAVIAAFVAAASAYPLSSLRPRDVDPAIVPEFGFQSGVNSTGESRLFANSTSLSDEGLLNRNW